jgi:outer membrane protein assembly factor BamB
LWRTKLSGPGAEGYSTPVVWRDQIILHHGQTVAGYALRDGALLWSVPVSSEGTGTPAIAGDMLYVGAAFADSELRDPIPDWITMVAKYDRDGDGYHSKDEFPSDLAIQRRVDAGNTPGAVVTYKRFFDAFVDQNHDGKVSQQEWEQAIKLISEMGTGAPRGIVAIHLEVARDLSNATIAWSEPRGAPEVPTPLVYQGRLFAIANGGVLSVLESGSGKLLYRGRVGAGGLYYSSPLVAGGRVYVSSSEGIVTVLDSESNSLKVIARNDLEEPIFATPAIVDGAIYVRTGGHLYAFGSPHE